MTTGQLDQAVGFRATAGQVKRVVRLNIGLNNNPFSAPAIAFALHERGVVDIDKDFIDKGQWDGNDEPTLVITGLTSLSIDGFTKVIETMTKRLTQQAIAFKYGGKGVLTYDPSFTGAKDEFNEEFFI